MRRAGWLCVLVASMTAGCIVTPPGSMPTPQVNRATVPPAPTASGSAAATLTLGAFGNADGPGLSVSDALASSGPAPLLVNGVLLKTGDGTVWLCEVLQQSSPPQCAEPRLLVRNMAPGDQTFVGGQGLHVADGVRWLERVQLFGMVGPP